MYCSKSVLRKAQTLTEEWIASSCRAKGILRGSPDEGEEWIGALCPLYETHAYWHTRYEKMSTNIPKTYQRANGQWVAKVFPLI